MTFLFASQRTRQSGLTMIELMIAMAIGLILTVAVLQVFVGSRVTYSTQSGLSKLQENGRFAMEFLTFDIRQTGYRGCSTRSSLTNTVNDGSGVSGFLSLSDSLEGSENVAGSTAYDGFNVVAGSDVLEVRYGSATNSCEIQAHDAAGASIQCQDTHTFQKGDVLIVSDCSHTAVFQQTNVNDSNDQTVIEHKTGQSVTPGNDSDQLGVQNAVYSFNSEASVMRMFSSRFFVARNGFGEPSLFREEIAINTGIGSAVSQVTDARELVEGVEDMQILYGEDTNNDDQPDKYVVASSVGDFDDVHAVRISLLMQSNEEGIVQGNQTVRFNGADRVFNDGRLRKVFTSTIALRNRL